ncbi:MAG: phage tail protein [Anaerolineae bacterium]|nr:phage tail protein [Anaerolineae bacterium]
MAQNKDHIKSTYPLPVYNYQVTVLKDAETLVIGFAEVSGLSVEYEPVTYKHGLSFVMGNKFIPGMRQPIRLTMKKGIVKSGDFLQSWIYNTYTDPFFSSANRDILIDLCDESGKPVIRWTVRKALPIKLDAPTFDANSNDVAIETMEVIADYLQVDYDP